MIDWITATIPLRHSTAVRAGVLEYAEDETGAGWRLDKFRSLEGSFESSVAVKSVSDAIVEYDIDFQTGELSYSKLWISGNPSKFLQGHNLFGSDDLRKLAPIYFARVSESLGITPTESDIQSWHDGHYKLDRVDVARMLELGSRQNVADYLSALSYQATVVNRGRGSTQCGTSTWGKRQSRNTVLKAYDKFSELNASKKHALHKGIPYRDKLLQFSETKVRQEAEFHSRYLDKAGLRSASQWSAATAGELYESEFSKMNISNQKPLLSNSVANLPPKFKRTYLMWETGRDIQSCMAKATFYRHRAELMKRCDIDIAQPYRPSHKSVVVAEVQRHALTAVLKPSVAQVPQWARGTSLLAA